MHIWWLCVRFDKVMLIFSISEEKRNKPLPCSNTKSQSYGFSCSHVRMWELDDKEGWVSKNWCFWIMVLEKTFESAFNYREIKPANFKGNQPWIFIWRTDAEAEVPIHWTSDVKSRIIGKDPDVGKDWRQKEKRAAEKGMVR